MQSNSAPAAQRGVSRSAELAVLMPVLLGVLFFVIVVAITAQGRSVVQEAANLGAEHAAFHGSSVQVGADKARQFAEDHGLREVDVTVWLDGAVVGVTVTAWAPNPLGTRFGQVRGTANRVQEMG